MLQITPVLAAVLVDDALERGAHLRVVLAAPDSLEQQGQLFGDLALGAVLLRVDLVAPRQVDLVLVQHEVLGEDVGVREALQHGVHEARVAVVAQAYDTRHSVGRYVRRSRRRHPDVARARAEVVAALMRRGLVALRAHARHVPHHLIDELLPGGPAEHLLAARPLLAVLLQLASLAAV